MGTGKILYDGIREVINGKAVFMRQSMQHGQVYGQIAERLKEEEFRRKLESYRKEEDETEWKKPAGYTEGGDGITCVLTEEGLEYLFDELFSGKILRRLKEADDPAYRMYALPMFLNGVEKEVDITCFVIYGLICNQRCRQMLWAELPEGDDYYKYYEQSRYRSWAMEECLKAEEIWDARLLTGLLEKVRQEEENGPAYRLLMKIMDAGYGELRQWLSGKTMVTGTEIKTQVFATHSGEYSMLYCISEIVLAMVIAQDSGVEVCFDYEMLLLLHFMERGETEMREGSGRGPDGGSTEKAEDGNRKFIKKFRKKYGTVSSLEALVFRNGTKRMDSLLSGVMAQYHISPRMFCGLELTEEEVEALLGLNDNWTVKSYWSMLVIAHLCKYIEALKERYLAHTAENFRQRPF